MLDEDFGDFLPHDETDFDFVDNEMIDVEMEKEDVDENHGDVIEGSVNNNLDDHVMEHEINKEGDNKEIMNQETQNEEGDDEEDEIDFNFDVDEFGDQVNKDNINTEIEEYIPKVRQSRYGRKRQGKDKWNMDETDQFYLIIRKFGFDFSLIQQFFPSRTRKQIKNKFKKEEKDNPDRIDHAFKNPLTLELESFCEMLNISMEDLEKQADEAQKRAEKLKQLRNEIENPPEETENQNPESVKIDTQNQIQENEDKIYGTDHNTTENVEPIESTNQPPENKGNHEDFEELVDKEVDPTEFTLDDLDFLDFDELN